MKATRKLIPALAMLLVSAMMLSTASYAWFSMNTTVAATGMQIKAEAVGSLVIKQDTAPSATDNSTAVVMTVPGNITMKDCTHDWTVGADTGLKTVKNRAEVDPNTGAALDGKKLEFEAVATGTAYYVDYTVVIASKNAEVTTSTINASVKNASGPVFSNAVTIDFYVGSVSEANFKGSAVSGGAAVSLGTDSIPVANGADGVKVIMRVYIDGAVSSVFTNQYDPATLSVDVQFDAVVA